ncbi:hypothetical protein GCM10011371_18490 [Novosphingobium marinum]|uniref:Uncharacterized protein n=1 Tax=Novosphingobium marinum TaxID=1514948 RepID=A0A7Z0BW22_9SPHN|nr:hypothetical protein [Novosphingobium marinum]NYH95960.1 hypothetical protein [Novosphingobium marinum]GGC31376.1 hypothetical protein GCM10011371_18490 [Novosphingobium marinum]
MQQGYKYYSARAAEAKAEAAESTLKNVRLRALRSEAMFSKLADHARKVEAVREKARLKKADDAQANSLQGRGFF